MRSGIASLKCGFTTPLREQRRRRAPVVRLQCVAGGETRRLVLVVPHRNNGSASPRRFVSDDIVGRRSVRLVASVRFPRPQSPAIGRPRCDDSYAVYVCDRFDLTPVSVGFRLWQSDHGDFGGSGHGKRPLS